MSMYRCQACDDIKDSDYDVCVENPLSSEGLICEDCFIELEEKLERTSNPSNGVFNPESFGEE